MLLLVSQSGLMTDTEKPGGSEPAQPSKPLRTLNDPKRGTSPEGREAAAENSSSWWVGYRPESLPRTASVPAAPGPFVGFNLGVTRN